MCWLFPSADTGEGGGGEAEEDGDDDAVGVGAFEVEGEVHGLFAIDLDAAVEGEDGAVFGEVDVEGGGSGFGGELLGDHAVGDFLEGGVFIGGVAFEEAVELAGVVVVSALEDGVDLGGAFELFVFDAGCFGAVVEEEALAAGVEAEDGLLGFELAELDAGVLVGGDVEEVVAAGVAEGDAGFFLIAGLEPLVGLV